MRAEHIQHEESASVHLQWSLLRRNQSKIRLKRMKPEREGVKVSQQTKRANMLGDIELLICDNSMGPRKRMVQMTAIHSSISSSESAIR